MVAIVICFVRDIHHEVLQLEPKNNHICHLLQIENSDIVNNRLIRKLQTEL